MGIVKVFEGKAKEESKLSTWRNGELDTEDGNRRAWEQGNLAMSRKQVAPILRACLE